MAPPAWRRPAAGFESLVCLTNDALPYDPSPLRVLRALNLNAPVNGVRPNPLFGNIVEVVDDAASRQHTVNVFWQVNILPPSPAPSKELWNWKRTNFGVNYGFGKQDNNSDGAFSVPATGSLASEWGPANFDVRNRLNRIDARR